MASSNVRVTTQIVQFGEGSGADPYADLHLSAEIDDRDDGLNGGDTDFQPGDTAYFLVFKSTSITLSNPVASAGSCAYQGTTSVEKVDFVSFANEDEGSLDVPAASIVSKDWVGQDLGATTLQSDQVTLKLDSPPSGIYAGVLRVTYVATATVGALVSPAALSVGGEEVTDFEIAVVIVGTAGS